jgi:hypothetical protein
VMSVVSVVSFCDSRFIFAINEHQDQWGGSTQGCVTWFFTWPRIERNNFLAYRNSYIPVPVRRAVSRNFSRDLGLKGIIFWPRGIVIFPCRYAGLSRNFSRDLVLKGIMFWPTGTVIFPCRYAGLRHVIFHAISY